MQNDVLELEPASIEEGDSTLWEEDTEGKPEYDGAQYQQQQQQRPAMAEPSAMAEPPAMPEPKKRKPETRKVGWSWRGGDSKKDDLIRQIRQPTISVNKHVGTYRIPNEDVDKTLRNPEFEIFRVDSGMNINVPRGKIKELRFRIVLYGDGKQSKSVFAVSGFPNDKIKNIKILSGKIGLSINNLLRIIPHPVTESVANIVTMDLNPWEIDWAYDKLIVGFSEAMTNDLDWYLSSDNVNQSFQCYLTLKKHISVKRVSAKVTAVWKFEAHDEGIIAWLRRRFRNKLYSVKSNAKEIEIIE